MTEKRMLFISLAAILFFALFGTTWGLYTNSGMIIFDRIYSLTIREQHWINVNFTELREWL